MQTAGSALGGVLGMAMGGMSADANYHDQKKLMNLQLSNQKELNEYNQQLAMKFWEDTNYNAQREQMEKAGLNVGLMYGGQGQGGQTMNLGGNASGGSIEGRNGLSGMGMQIGADVALKIAQTKNIQAHTKKIEGVDTEEARTDCGLWSCSGKTTRCSGSV